MQVCFGYYIVEDYWEFRVVLQGISILCCLFHVVVSLTHHILYPDNTPSGISLYICLYQLFLHIKFSK